MKTKICSKLITLFLFACSLFAVFFPPHILAQDKQDIPSNEDVYELRLYSEILGTDSIKTDSSAVGNDRAVGATIQRIVNRFFVVVFTISATVMVVLLAFHGTQMIYAQLNGSVSGYVDAKKRVKDIAIGSALLLVSWVFLNFIGGDLLRPKLFRTVTGLKYLGTSDDFLTTELEVPEGAVESVISSDTSSLTFNLCPKPTDLFDSQLDRIAESAGINSDNEVKYYYYVLYSRIDSDDIEKKEVVCDKKKSPPASPVTIKGKLKTIAVFPVVRIEGVETVSKTRPETGSVVGSPEKKVLKSWRGLPLRIQTLAGVATILQPRFKQCTGPYSSRPVLTCKSNCFGYNRFIELDLSISGFGGFEGGSSADRDFDVVTHSYRGNDSPHIKAKSATKFTLSGNTNFSKDSGRLKMYFNKDVKKVCVEILVPIRRSGRSTLFGEYQDTPIGRRETCFDLTASFSDADGESYAAFQCL